MYINAIRASRWQVVGLVHSVPRGVQPVVFGHLAMLQGFPHGIEDGAEPSLDQSFLFGGVRGCGGEEGSLRLQRVFKGRLLEFKGVVRVAAFDRVPQLML